MCKPLCYLTQQMQSIVICYSIAISRSKLIKFSFVSPRTRAQRTLELLEIGCRERLPWNDERKPEEDEPIRTEARVEITDAVREWDYGDYEGLTSKQIKAQREKDGEKAWNIWTDGCPGGE